MLSRIDALRISYVFHSIFIIIFLLKLLFRYLQKVVYAFSLYSKTNKQLNIYTESLVNNQVYLGTVFV